MFNILLVEDNETIQKLNKEMLEEESGYKVRTAMNLAEARESIKQSTPNLIVLDIMLPDGSGLDFLKELRQTGADVPILLLTALSESSDEVKGIREGGDDYVAKPYDSEVLLVRIEKLLNQKQRADERVKDAVAQTKTAADVAEYGKLTVNNITQRAKLNGEDANFTPKEFSVLAYFLKNMDKKITPVEIYEGVWGQDSINNAGAIKVHISGIRKKLKMEDETSVVIETVERKYYICRFPHNEG
ncbi:MAG: response regulator transcription factor [Oscillospiraceae bacterium]|nr:response regulator transcription factor [Oscillospiraceae bacterium]